MYVEKPITILDLAKHRGAKPDAEGRYSGEEFARVKLAPVGGCCACAATLGAYNAAPMRTGYWACAKDESCHGGQGFVSVEEADRFIFGDRESGGEKVAYSDRFDGDEQVDAEEEIAGYLFNEGAIETEDLAGKLGREILYKVLRRFRPDLFVDAKEDENPLLDMLEELLSITEPRMRETEDWRKWQEISAKVADLRDGEDV